MFLELENGKGQYSGFVFPGLCLLIIFPRTSLAVVIRKHCVRAKDELRLIGLVGTAECVFFVVAELVVMKHAPRWKNHVALGFVIQ